MQGVAWDFGLRFKDREIFSIWVNCWSYCRALFEQMLLEQSSPVRRRRAENKITPLR